MGWQALLVSLVRALAWPVTVVILLLVLRRELGAVLARMTHGSLRVAGAELRIEVEALERQAEALLPGTKDGVGAEASDGDEDAGDDDDGSVDDLVLTHEQLLSLARGAPVAAIDWAWHLLAATLRDVVHDAGALMGVRSSGPYAWAHFLEAQSALPVGTADLIEQLGATRDAAVGDQHVREAGVATSFVNAATRVMDNLRRVDATAIRSRLHPPGRD